MPTRAYPQYVTSLTAPTGPQQGDEWFNPATNVLSKYVITNGTSPGWQTPVFVAANGTITTVGTFSGIVASGTADSIPVFLVPKGVNGYLSAAIPDNTLVGGNARGANAVDWSTRRGAANQVASGTSSVIGGGDSNRATGYITVVAGGVGNAAVGGYASVLGGLEVVANQSYSAAVGGFRNTASGVFNFVGGGYGNTGTASAVVTTQATTFFAAGNITVTLSGSNASIKVGQYISGAGLLTYPTETYVAGISGTTLTLSQAPVSSGTPTLAFYNPHGIVVGGGNNQATGSYSFIGGGGDAGTAANRNVASGDWSFIGGGSGNVNAGDSSVICGGGNKAKGSNGNQIVAGINSAFIGGGFNHTINTGGNYSAIVAGRSNTNAGQSSFIGGGENHSATGGMTFIGAGQSGADRGVSAYHVFPSRNPLTGTVGNTQGGLLVLARETTTATPTVLCSDSLAAGATNQIILPNNSAYYFRGTVVAGAQAGGGGDTKGWFIEGVIKRGSSAANTALVGSATVTSNYANAGASSWTIAVTADTTNGGLAVTFTGQSFTTIRCVAKIETTEMTF